MPSDLPSQLAHLAPLIPQLARAWDRNRGQVPEVLRPADKPGGRHIAVLASVHVTGPGSVSDLAARMSLSMAHASKVVGELAHAGLVDRTSDPRDGRRVIVSLSAVAERAVAEMAARNQPPVERFLAELDGDEADTFITHCARLIELLSPGA